MAISIVALVRHTPADTRGIGWTRPRIRRRSRATAVAPRSRFLGCLLGSAVVGALRAPFQFMPRVMIFVGPGPKGINGYTPIYGGLNRIKDHTELILFLAEPFSPWLGAQGCVKWMTT